MRVLSPVLVGHRLPADVLDDDISYVLYLGPSPIPSTERCFLGRSRLSGRTASTSRPPGTCAPTYLDHTGLPAGWLVMVDLRKERSWEGRLFVPELACEVLNPLRRILDCQTRVRCTSP